MTSHLPPPPTLLPGSNVIAYLRDSGHENQELSIDQQSASIRAWCQQHNLILQHDHIFIDAARPGSHDENRAALQAMMNALRHGLPVSGVIVWSNSRLARNVTHAQFYRSEIRKLGYIYHSLTDKTSDGPEAIIFEALIDYKNQQMLEDMSIDVKRALRQLVESHGCVPGVPPRGFKRKPIIISHHRDGKPRTVHRWVPDPDLVPSVRQAFEMRASGASLGQIQKETRLYGSINSYRTFWPNKLYIGILEFGDLVIENYCDPIVPLEIWQRVQEIQGHYAGHHHVRADSPDHPRRISSRYLLSGFAYCARCDSPLFGRTSVRKNGKRYTAYFCTRAYRKRDCSKHRLPAEPLENAVIDALRDTYLQPDYLRAVRDQVITQSAGQSERLDGERKTLTAELATLRRQITHITDAIAESGHSPSLLRRLERLETDETTLLTRLADNQRQRQTVSPPEITLEQIASRLENINAALRSTDIQTQRAILRALIARIDVDREDRRLFGTITIYYPPPPTDNFAPAGFSNGGKVMPISATPSGPPQFRHTITFSTQTNHPSHNYQKNANHRCDVSSPPPSVYATSRIAADAAPPE